MPPSPAFRAFPVGEPKVESHKRGRSLEGSLLFREKDDDLTLFNEMQTKERESFLLQSSDDFEDVFSAKLRHFSDLKLGVSIPTRGESSQLLIADGEKNDYDWLLTPPDTPLFPSLDDEPPPVAARRGRPRSQPISLSRSSTMENSYRSSRGSASPNRLSPSPRSGNSALTRGRPSSASRSSPTPSVRSATPTPSVRSVTPTPSVRSGTPTRRPSPPPRKAAAACTPTSRRAVSPGIATSSGVRGTSPARTARGNSASPKIKAWQSSIPGFSLDAPPNLRTSLSDRPGSYVRGSSPASRNGRDVKFGRQSMSPTASRSVSSSHSHDRDRLSSQSKGSVASSGDGDDDDADSLQSVSVSSTACSLPVRVGLYPNNRASAFNKKSTKVMSPSSAPKRSIDSALRQMDQRKTPPNMFRPLLSSVPSTTFFVGKGSSNQRLISRNSSVTTSSNASSDQGTSVALDVEGSDLHHDDVTSQCGKIPYSDAPGEIFAIDNIDGLSPDAQNGGHEKMGHILDVEVDGDPALENGTRHFEKIDDLHNTEMELGSSCNALRERGDLVEIDSNDNTRICSRCTSRYVVSVPVEEDRNLCLDCNKKDYLDALPNMQKEGITSQRSLVLPVQIAGANKLFHESEMIVVLPESSVQVSEVTGPLFFHSEDNDKPGQTCSVGAQTKSLDEGDDRGQVIYESDCRQDMIDQLTCGCSSSQKDFRDQQVQLPAYSEVDSSGVAGITVLLNRSSSSNGPIFQGRTFAAATLPHEDLSYARDSLRSSNTHGSASASSSVDLSSSRQTETRLQRQLSSRRSDVENYKYDMNTKLQSSGLSLSRCSSNSHQSGGPAVSSHEELEVSSGRLKHDEEGALLETPSGGVLPEDNSEVELFCSSSTTTAIHREDDHEYYEGSVNDCSIPEILEVRILSEESAAVPGPTEEECLAYEYEDSPNKLRSGSDAEISLESSADRVNSGNADGDGLQTPGKGSLPTISEIEIDNGSPTSAIADESSIMHEIKDDPPEVSVPDSAENDVTGLGKEKNVSDHADGVLGASTVLVEGGGGTKARSLTLEEATDAILFCSSIVHDLAYQAATIALEKENPASIEEPNTAVMVLGKSNTDRKGPRTRTAVRRPSKSLKPWQKQAEMNLKLPAVEAENDENVDAPMVRNVGLPNNKVDSMKPPKLESKCNCSIM